MPLLDRFLEIAVVAPAAASVVPCVPVRAAVVPYALARAADEAFADAADETAEP